MKKYKVISTKNYDYLKQLLLKNYPNNLSSIKLEQGIYSDTEKYDILSKTDIEDQHILIIGGTAFDGDVLDIIDYGSAIAKYGAKTITILCPYFGYSTNERAVQEGEIVRAKTRARMLSGIPQAKEGNSILLFDLHSEGIPYYFEGPITSKHIYGKEFIESIIKNDLKINDSNKDEYVLASTDAGRAKWIESLGKSFNMNTAFCYKQRSGEKVSLTGINADVNGKNIIMYDDMIRSGNSLINAANAYKKAGAKKIYVITTHGLFVKKQVNPDGSFLFKKPEEVEQDIFDTLLFDQIFCSNSHPNSQFLKKTIIKDISMNFLT